MSKDEKVIIVLPDTLYITRMPKNQDIITMSTEYSIYFRNIIHPYDEKWDVQVKCQYGRNLGNYWRLSNNEHKESRFDFEIVVYNEYGERIASKKCDICVADKKEDKETDIMFIGDSMTYSQTYINHIVSNMNGIKTIGTRSLDGIIKQEGRGGWNYDQYFEAWYDCFGLSHFLFPKNVDGKQYYGNKEFADEVMSGNATTYTHYGFHYDDIEDGQYYTKDKKLFKKEGTAEKLISENPKFDFDFKKYLERFELPTPEIVSILMGANDLQICPYEQSNIRIDKFVSQTNLIIKKIQSCSDKLKIIINLPIIGAEQFSWGVQLGCTGSSKMYRYNMIHAADALIKEFDNRQSENIFISPMLACIDPVYGFSMEQHKANKYSENLEFHHSNWVHPNYSGYCQMGDALIGVIENIR